MRQLKLLRTLGVSILLLLLASFSGVWASNVRTVFVIAMENHNWTQPTNQFNGDIQQIFHNPNAPYINSLVNGTASISDQVSYAAAYHNVLATETGNNPHIHPSEPNYIWSEAGNNFRVFNGNDPCAGQNVPGSNVQFTTKHLSTLISNAGRTWRSYQEDIDLAKNGSTLDNVVEPRSDWTVPLASFRGVFAFGSNAYNGSKQFNYTAGHNPMVFFADSNGNCDFTTANPMRFQYAPLQQLANDLAENTVAEYNWITPDQYNNMHSLLAGGFQGFTGGAAMIRQGDNFLSKIVPAIMASKAYKEHGVIIIWFDESEQDGNTVDNPDDFNHTIPEIVISEDARQSGSLPFATLLNLTHSSDLRTMENIFHLKPPYLGDAVHATDLSDLFRPGSVQR
jgi:phosphatidylinositol-3-phosphatase